jgi:hypothetical protein
LFKAGQLPEFNPEDSMFLTAVRELAHENSMKNGG